VAWERTIDGPEKHRAGRRDDNFIFPHPLSLGVSFGLAAAVRLPKRLDPCVDGQSSWKRFAYRVTDICTMQTFPKLQKDSSPSAPAHQGRRYAIFRSILKVQRTGNLQMNLYINQTVTQQFSSRFSFPQWFYRHFCVSVNLCSKSRSPTQDRTAFDTPAPATPKPASEIMYVLFGKPSPRRFFANSIFLGERASSSGSSTPVTSSQGSETSTPTCTYNLDRFIAQDMYGDGTMHGRVQDQHGSPHRPNVRDPFYQARAATAIAVFDAANRHGQR